jgi:RimJ/RimL family protein N-acetyltransferase
LGFPYQGHGSAAEAAREVHEVVAHIHPDHAASARVARRAGLQPTGDRVDGEMVWRTVIDGFARSLWGAGQAEGGSSASASTVWKRAPTER